MAVGHSTERKGFGGKGSKADGIFDFGVCGYGQLGLMGTGSKLSGLPSERATLRCAQHAVLSWPFKESVVYVMWGRVGDMLSVVK